METEKRLFPAGTTDPETGKLQPVAQQLAGEVGDCRGSGRETAGEEFCECFLSVEECERVGEGRSGGKTGGERVEEGNEREEKRIGRRNGRQVLGETREKVLERKRVVAVEEWEKRELEEKAWQ